MVLHLIVQCLMVLFLMVLFLMILFLMVLFAKCFLGRVSTTGKTLSGTD